MTDPLCISPCRHCVGTAGAPAKRSSVFMAMAALLTFLSGKTLMLLSGKACKGLYWMPAASFAMRSASSLKRTPLWAGTFRKEIAISFRFSFMKSR